MSSSPSLLSALRSLPPSQEVLDFYRDKVDRMHQEERQWVRRAAGEAAAAAKLLSSEQRLHHAQAEVGALQRGLADVQIAIGQERKRNAKLAAENDKAKVFFLNFSLSGWM